jgi:homoserine O-acetyltransferase
VSKTDHIFHYHQNFELEAGGNLSGFQLKYTTVGHLNRERNNAVWVCHALSGSSDFTDWWKDFFVEGSAFDPNHHFIICANVIGGCYGSTGPLSNNPKTGKNYFHDFPLITVRDIVRSLDLLRIDLGLDQINTLIGGSLGGQQALEWAILQPEVIQNLIIVATNARHSPWGIAFNEAQRLAIAADTTWKENDARAGMEGLKAARAIGMISYRAYKGFGETQSEKDSATIDDFRASSYQRYQGQKLANRFNAFTYWTLSKAMDSHHVGRGRKSIEAALQRIQAETLVIGIESDILFPIAEQEFLAANIPHAQFEKIDSLFGHDGFLVEIDQFKKILKKFRSPKKSTAALLK